MAHFESALEERTASSQHLETSETCQRVHLYLLHVEPRVQYVTIQFCSFGSRYASADSRQSRKKTLDAVGKHVFMA